MLKVITFQEHTISAFSLLLGDRRWVACYTICNNGTLVRNGRAASPQPSPHAAEIAGMLHGIRHVQERLGSRSGI
jgi:hypothetical protein